MESLNIITHKNNPSEHMKQTDSFLEEPKSPAVVFTCSVEVTHGFNECDEV